MDIKKYPTNTTIIKKDTFVIRRLIGFFIKKYKDNKRLKISNGINIEKLYIAVHRLSKFKILKSICPPLINKKVTPKAIGYFSIFIFILVILNVDAMHVL